jgi:hypothetical protein
VAINEEGLQEYTLEDAVDIKAIEALKAEGSDKVVQSWEQVKKDLNL